MNVKLTAAFQNAYYRYSTVRICAAEYSVEDEQYHLSQVFRLDKVQNAVFIVD